jgi:hypothetical protein
MEENGYPTEEELTKIKTWDFPKNGSIQDFIEFIQKSWYYEDRFVLKGKNILRLYLSTGGWSGNESVIGAMRENWTFWMMTWQKSVRGGHYWFKIDIKLFEKK